MSDINGRVFIGSLLISLLMHGAILFLVKVEKAPAGQKEPEKITVSLRQMVQEEKPVPVAEPLPEPQPVVKQPKPVKKPLPVAKSLPL